MTLLTDFVGRLLTDTELPMVGIQDTETHLRRRKNWNRGMGPAAVREYEHFIARRARQLVERLEEQQHKGGAVVIGNWFNYFSCVSRFSFCGFEQNLTVTPEIATIS